MNTRLKEFEAQCWTQVPCDFDMREGGASTIRAVFDREKFAKLIIRDCCSEIQGCNLPISASAYHLDKIAQTVEQHFGVDSAA